MVEETKTEQQKTDVDIAEQFCPACWLSDVKSKMHAVKGIQQLAENPAQLAGGPRVVECEKKCRFTLEPYFKRKKKVLYCYICILSETTPKATCEHHWINPAYVSGFDAEADTPDVDGWYSPLTKDGSGHKK